MGSDHEMAQTSEHCYKPAGTAQHISLNGLELARGESITNGVIPSSLDTRVSIPPDNSDTRPCCRFCMEC